MKNTRYKTHKNPTLTYIRRNRVLQFLTYGIGLRFYNRLRMSKFTRYRNIALYNENPQSNNEHIISPCNDFSLTKEPWPFAKKVAMTISFDDLSPVKEPGFSDFGGNLEGPCVQRFKRLMSLFPYIKVTHFVPVVMSYDPIMSKFTNRENSIDDIRFLSWRQQLKRCTLSGRVEVALHGVYHYNWQYESPAEFAGLDYDEAKDLIKKSICIMSSAGFTPLGFRPPAWDLGHDYCAVDAARDLGLEYISASGVGIGINKNNKTVSDLYPCWFRGIINIPQNITLGLPGSVIRRILADIKNKRGLLSIKGHFVHSYYMSASLNVFNFWWLKHLLERIDNYRDDIWFATCSEIARFKRALDSIEFVFLSDDVLLVKNESNFKMDGLSLKVSGASRFIQKRVNSEDRIIILPSILPKHYITVDLSSKERGNSSEKLPQR